MPTKWYKIESFSVDVGHKGDPDLVQPLESSSSGWLLGGHANAAQEGPDL